MTPKKEKLLSLAVPCYNEALALPYFIEEIQKIRPLLPEINIEVVLINDGSKDDSAYGWTSMTCIILLLSGVQLFCLGIIGQYIAKMYTEIKKRPHYIVDKNNHSENINPKA